MNRRKTNIVPVAALCRWVVAAFFLCVTGLSYVYCKNQMCTTGNEIKNLESQLAALQTQDDVVRSQISKLSSHAYLQRKLTEGVIKMIPITEEHIVRMSAVSRTAANDAVELQPVANRVMRQ